MFRRHFLVLTFLALPLALSPAQASEGAEGFLRSFGQQAIEQLADESVPYQEREARFKSLLDQGFDLEAISRFVIAREWRGAAESDREAFIQVFKDYLAQRFLPLFEGYADTDFVTNGARQDQDNAALSWVRVVFRDNRGQPVQTDWRVREVEGGFRILDVRAEGASMALTLREEYAAVMRQQGGLSGLVERLREQVARGAFRPT